MAMVVSQSYIKYHSEYHPILLHILAWKWTLYRFILEENTIVYIIMIIINIVLMFTPS